MNLKKISSIFNNETKTIIVNKIYCEDGKEYYLIMSDSYQKAFIVDKEGNVNKVLKNIILKKQIINTDKIFNKFISIKQEFDFYQKCESFSISFWSNEKSFSITFELIPYRPGGSTTYESKNNKIKVTGSL